MGVAYEVQEPALTLMIVDTVVELGVEEEALPD